MKIYNVSTNWQPITIVGDGGSYGGVTSPGSVTDLSPMGVSFNGTNYTQTVLRDYSLVISDTDTNMVAIDGHGIYALEGMAASLPFIGLLCTAWAIRKGVSIYRRQNQSTEV